MKTTGKIKINIALILLAFVTIQVTSFAQNCKYDVDKKDDFTGESVKSISTILWGNKMNNYLTWVTTKKGSEYTVELGIVFDAELNEMMGIDDVVMVKLTDGQSITLTPVAETAPKSFVMGSMIRTVYAPNFKLDQATMEKLSKSVVTAVRINLDKPYDFDFKKRYVKNCEKLMEASGCMLQ